MTKFILAEKILASLLGWFDIVIVEDKLIGFPIGVNSKKQFRQSIPQYTRDQEETDKLIAQYNVKIIESNDGLSFFGDTYVAQNDPTIPKEFMKRYLVVLETIEILEEEIVCD